jgi:hypothetical protein
MRLANFDCEYAAHNTRSIDQDVNQTITRQQEVAECLNRGEARQIEFFELNQRCGDLLTNGS